MTPRQRSSRVARHVRLGAVHERALILALQKIIRRIGRRAASEVAAGRFHNAEHVRNEDQAALFLALRSRLGEAARASGALVLEELTGEAKADAGRLETKFISLSAIVENAIANWLSQYAARKVVQIAESLRGTIRGVIVRGNEADKAPREIARDIRDKTDGEIGLSRARTIARTETGIAASVGANTAADATGLTLDKEWASTHGKRTRPAHENADGQVVAMDETFDVGGEALRYPRDPFGSAGNVINCRCICLYRPRIST